MAATRARLGRRLIHVSVGGALVPPHLLRFLQSTFAIGGPGGGNCVVTNG